MLSENTPLILRDELAKMAREASPENWLNDAFAEIEAWRTTMPGAERIQFSVTTHSDGPGLELRCSDGWGKITGFALYTVEPAGIRFYPGNPEMMPKSTLSSEQAFIGHLVALLHAKFAPRR